MRSAKTKGMLLVILLLLAALSACSDRATPTSSVQLDELQVRTIVNDMLESYNVADYAAFTKNLAPAMTQAIDETSFKTFCAQSVDSLGKYRWINSLQQVESDKYSATWLIEVKFVHSTEFFHLRFNSSGQVEAMDFGPNQ